MIGVGFVEECVEARPAGRSLIPALLSTLAAAALLPALSAATTAAALSTVLVPALPAGANLLCLSLSLRSAMRGLR